MAYRGRLQLGQEVFLSVLTTDASGTPVTPADCPQMKVWSNVTTQVLNKKLPVLDKFNLTGLFGMNVFLDGAFSTGMIRVTYQWLTGSYVGFEEDGFEIVAGGNADGAVVAITPFMPPHASFLLAQLDSGRIIEGRNPRM